MCAYSAVENWGTSALGVGAVTEATDSWSSCITHASLPSRRTNSNGKCAEGIPPAAHALHPAFCASRPLWLVAEVEVHVGQHARSLHANAIQRARIQAQRLQNRGRH